MKVRRRYAFCCIEGGGRPEGCSCDKPNHGTAIVDTRKMLPGDKPIAETADDARTPDDVVEALGEVKTNIAWAEEHYSGPEFFDVAWPEIRKSLYALIAALTASGDARERALAFGDPVPIPCEAYEFLMGTGPLRGCQFGEQPEGEKGRFWWRKDLARIQRALLDTPAEGEAK